MGPGGGDRYYYMSTRSTLTKSTITCINSILFKPALYGPTQALKLILRILTAMLLYFHIRCVVFNRSALMTSDINPRTNVIEHVGLDERYMLHKVFDNKVDSLYSLYMFVW